MITTLPQRYGKYILLRKIALGGMAEIFRAKTIGAEGFEKTIVIKRILPHYTEDESFVKMFIDEASIASKLQHSNIVQIFDFDNQDDRYYIAMEYVEGRDLKTVINKARSTGSPLSVPQCVWICMEVAKGLQYAHTKEYNGEALNVVHRDVSPHNIMVSYAGEVKVMDFGIAKAAQRSTKTLAGQVKGKCAYMSPEQAKGKPLDGRSDLFALGIILWEILTNKRLFLGESDFETLSNVLKSQPPAPSTINPDVPPELDEIVMKALSKDRDERYADMEEFGRALTKWLYGSVDDLDSVSLKPTVQSLFEREIKALQEEYEHERDMTEKVGTSPGGNPGLPDSASAVSGPGTGSGTHGGPDTSTGAYGIQGRQRSSSNKVLGIAAALLLAASGAWMYLTGGMIDDGNSPGSVANTAAENAAPSGSPATLIVNTQPATAEVTANGLTVNGPLTNFRIGDQVSLIADAEGYERAVRTIKVTARTQKMNLILEKSAAAPVTAILQPSDPNATVLVDGRTLGPGEQRFAGVDGQTIAVEVRPAGGGTPITQTLTLASGMAPVAIQVGPQKQPAQLFVLTNPSDSMISSNVGKLGRSGDAWTLEGISIGDMVEVNASRPGYVSQTQKVEIKNANQTLSITMKRPLTATAGSSGGGSGSLVVNAKPWADVWVDGVSKGRTKLNMKSVSAGTHKVKLFNKKLNKTVTRTVTVRAGKKATVFVDMTK